MPILPNKPSMGSLPLAAQQIQPTGIGLLDALLQLLYRDPFGGLAVTNPGSAPFQFLEREFPKVTTALTRAPAKFTFETLPSREIAKVVGDRATIAATEMGPFSRNINFLLPPPSTYRMQAGYANALLHEILHGLYAAKDIRQFPLLSLLRGPRGLPTGMSNVVHQAPFDAMAAQMIQRAQTPFLDTSRGYARAIR